VARQVSAGVLAYRRRNGHPEFLLVHPGGPYWAGRDANAWSMPKGLVEAGEESWITAAREFEEEVGQPIHGDPEPLTACRTGSGKEIRAWLVEADLDVSAVSSKSFEMEWPPRSGRRRSFPEVDRAGWFPPRVALAKIHLGQRPILLEAIARLTGSSEG
jgi:predicted NUDIX family NTP pyrophosphohydrolase